MFSFWSSKPAAPTNGEHDSADSASPPPPSVLTETPAPTSAKPTPKPRKPRKSIKKPSGDGDGEGAGQDASKTKTENGATKDKDSEATPAPTADSLTGLRELVTTVPPKALHIFVMQRLDAPGAKKGKGKRANENVFPTLEADFPVLSAFFSGLVAPPKLHCKRCHADYTEIENGPRSCVKEHDDDSAYVRKAEKQGIIHETFWGCCGQTVDGDGDQGPPAGWCYEGPHTDNREEARYREDGDEEDDKLGDCAKLRCGQAPRKPKRKRPVSEHSDSDDEDIDLIAIEPRERHARRKSSISRPRARQGLLSDEDVEMTDATVDRKPIKAVKSAPKAKKSTATEEIKKEAKKEAKEVERASSVGAKGKGRGGKVGGKAAPASKASDDAKEGKKEKEAATKKNTKKRKTDD